jgi:hypothetical protein
MKALLTRLGLIRATDIRSLPLHTMRADREQADRVAIMRRASRARIAARRAVVPA